MTSDGSSGEPHANFEGLHREAQRKCNLSLVRINCHSRFAVRKDRDVRVIRRNEFANIVDNLKWRSELMRGCEHIELGTRRRIRAPRARAISVLGPYASPHPRRSPLQTTGARSEHSFPLRRALRGARRESSEERARAPAFEVHTLASINQCIGSDDVGLRDPHFAGHAALSPRGAPTTNRRPATTLSIASSHVAERDEALPELQPRRVYLARLTHGIRHEARRDIACNCWLDAHRRVRLKKANTAATTSGRTGTRPGFLAGLSGIRTKTAVAA